MGNVLLVDISSGETSAALGQARARSLIYTEERSREALEHAMLLSLKQSLSRLRPSGAVSQALVTISSPWIVSGFNLDLGALNAVSSVEHELMAKERIGKGVFTSAIGKDLAWRIENEFVRTAGARKGLVFRSSLSTLYDALVNAYDLEDAMLVNVSHETTEVLALKDKVSSLAFDFGLRHIIQAIAKEFGISETIAESYLSLYIEGDFAEETRVKIDKVLDYIELGWQNKWRNKDDAKTVYLRAPQKLFKLVKAFVQGVLPRSKIVVYNGYNA